MAYFDRALLPVFVEARAAVEEAKGGATENALSSSGVWATARPTRINSNVVKIKWRPQRAPPNTER
jgi:hypothetical protein